MKAKPPQTRRRVGRDPDRERKIQAALRAAMRQARGEPKPAAEVRNPIMERAFAKAGVKSPSKPDGKARASVQSPPKKVVIATTPPSKKKAATASPQPHPKKSVRKRNLADKKVAKAKVANKLKKQIKEAAKRRAEARRRADAEHAGREEKARRETERIDGIETFIRDIETARFTELIDGWRRHVEFVDYIRRTGVNRHRLELYERLVRCIEREWERRSNLRHHADEYFDWPTTKAKRGLGSIGDLGWVEKGVLGYLGYQVGEKSTLTEAHRHAILRRVFRMHLPPIESPDYMAEWSKPESAGRLKKMANSIASFARQAKRQSSRHMGEAIDSWERDLKMLHDEYYVSKFGFGWPAM